MNTLKRLFKFPMLAVCFALAGCLGMPDGVKPVSDFELEPYLGKWYEIARLDHSFERGLQRVTAEYSLRDDGGVRVINRGFDVDTGEWQEAEGKAYFAGPEDEAYLKVSFFGPFYGSYVVFELGDDYEYSFVAGADTGYLWLLSRSPEVSPELLAHFRERAERLGFETSDLVIVDHP